MTVTRNRIPAQRVARALMAAMASAALLAGSTAAAQTQTPVQPPAGTGDYATRAQLEAEAASHPDRAEAIQRRLREGDLQVGDRIALQVRGQPALTDTFAVRAGRVIEIPGLPQIPVAGVLRSELKNHLTEQLGRYVRDPELTEVTPLIRLEITGSVGRPGFYALPADLLISDAIMYAGGPSGDADMGKSLVRRGDDEFIEKDQFKEAVTAGKTLDQMDLRAGDQIDIGKRNDKNWYTVLRTVSLGLALTGTLIAVFH